MWKYIKGCVIGVEISPFSWKFYQDTIRNVHYFYLGPICISIGSDYILGWGD